VRTVSSASVIVFTCGLHLVAFQVSPPTPPRPDIADTFPSASEPSHLHTGIDFVMTIQFHHWINGESQAGGTLPIAEAGPPRQIAVPIPRVSVGVTNIRIKLVGELVPKYPPAEDVPLHVPVN
jgi:hypothetical protein